MKGGTDRAWELALAAVAFAGAVVVGLYVVRPFIVGPIGPDAAAPVVEFERLIAGQRLEGYLSQTSKPLLTLLYGIARIGTGDWRSVSILAIASFAAFVAAASVLAYRIGGLLPASFVAVAFALAPELLSDVTQAYGVSWAMLACTVAGLMVVGQRRWYWIAGLALAAGTLARPEVLAVTAVALFSVAVAALGGRAGRWVGPDRRAWLVGLGLLALPILSLHDLLLSGDPLLWANVAQANSAGSDTRGLVGMLEFVARYGYRVAPLLPLAGIALLVLAVRGHWTEAIVVAIVPVAVTAFFIASGARGTVITARYLLPINLGIVFAGGLGLAAVDVPIVRRATMRFRGLSTGWARPCGIVALGAVLALVLAPSWPSSPAVRASVAHHRAKQLNAQRAFAALSSAVGPVPAWRGVPTPPNPQTIVYIPPRLRAQGIVDLDLPLWAGTKLFAPMVDPAAGRPAPGSILYHDALDGERGPTWREVEVSKPTVVGRLMLTPILVDSKAGIWILKVGGAPAGSD